MTPRDQLKRLLEVLAEKALDNLEQYGFHVPVALVIQANGKDNFVIPDPDGDLSDGKQVESLILAQVRRMAAGGAIRAVCFAKTVHITIAHDAGGTTDTDAIKLILDHADEEGYTAYLSYTLADGRATPGTIHYEPLAERLFPIPPA